MAQIIRNSGFQAQDIVTSTKLHNLVDTASIGPEAISSQTQIPTGASASTDFLLGYDTSVSAIRKYQVNDILANNLACSFTDVQLGLKNITDFAWNSPEVVVKGEFRIQMPNVEGSRSTGSEEDQSYNETHTSVPADGVYADSLILSKRIPVGDSPENSAEFQQTLRLKKTGIITSGSGEFIVSTELTGIHQLKMDTAPLLTFVHYSENATTGIDTHEVQPVPDSTRLGGTFLCTFGNTGGSVLQVDFPVNTNVQVDGRFRTTSGLIYVGEEKALPEDETIVDLNDAIKGVYSYSVGTMSPATWSSNGDTRQSAANVPLSGKVLYTEDCVLLPNEVWTLEYDGYIFDDADDPFTVVYLVDNVAVKTYQFNSNQHSDKYCGWFLNLDGGEEGKTFNIKIRGAVNTGSGQDLFTIFSNLYKSTRKVVKTRA